MIHLLLLESFQNFEIRMFVLVLLQLSLHPHVTSAYFYSKICFFLNTTPRHEATIRHKSHNIYSAGDAFPIEAFLLPWDSNSGTRGGSQ